jgi:hypothetical protein
VNYPRFSGADHRQRRKIPPVPLPVAHIGTRTISPWTGWTGWTVHFSLFRFIKPWTGWTDHQQNALSTQTHTNKQLTTTGQG